ncbi:MAG: AAA family ATPase [Phycisphaerales bacterium]|nr:MAG: AAA family ATPase [Phycisphaerales bacterium]
MLNQKGGVGKTTTVVNLAAALAAADHRVCVIDLDPQSHLTLHLGIDALDAPNPRTAYDLLLDPDCVADEVIVTARPNLDLIPSEVDLAGAETELAVTPDRQRILSPKFSTVADRYDFVFIDCPPSLGLLALNALSLAREVFVPMQAHFLALQGVGKLLATVGLVCQSVNPLLRVTGIVLCMHEGQTTLAREVVADLDEFFEQARDQTVPWRDCRVLRPAIRRNIKLAEAPSFGKTIFDYAPWCAGAQDYRKLAQRLLADSSAAAMTQEAEEPAPVADQAARVSEAPAALEPDEEPPSSDATESEPVSEPDAEPAPQTSTLLAGDEPPAAAAVIEPTQSREGQPDWTGDA